jgi:LCP family protein required for cell wall assembly
MEQHSQTQYLRKTKRHRKWVYRSLFIFLVILGGSMGYFVHSIYDALSQGLDRDARGSNLREGDIYLEKNPFAILLVGEDGKSLEGKNWRPDVLMVVTINPITKSIKLLSIPRDTYVRIANTDIETKINAAAHHGYQNGIDPIQNIRETVENLLNIPIDHYVKANFTGFLRAVDLLGGVDVNVEYDFRELMSGGKYTYFTKGPMHLNGSEALAYVRMRKKDPEGIMAEISGNKKYYLTSLINL